ncbi:uncharacterized protein LOC120345762 [Styela clava]
MTKRYKWQMDVADSEEDWLKAKKVLVKSFQKYPLYAHLEPNEGKRPEFMRRYLEANYDVAVRHGKGILMVLRCQDTEIKTQEGRKEALDIRGALLFVPPADDGIAWALQDDNLYWEAYKKYKLAEVSQDCLQRVIEYELWEQETVTKLLRKARAPMWNGLFCAIDPDLCLHGLGSVVFRKTVEIMLRYQTANDQHQKEILIEMSKLQNGEACNGQNSLVDIHRDVEENHPQSNDVGILTRLWNIFSSHSHEDNDSSNIKPTCSKELKQTPQIENSHREYWMKFLHGLALLHHMPVPSPTTLPKHESNGKCSDTPNKKQFRRKVSNRKKDIKEDDVLSPENQATSGSLSNKADCDAQANRNNCPVIAAISHSSVTSHFYAKNGFHHVTEIPYQPESSRDDPVPFNAHVLLMDPLKTGKIEIISSVFCEGETVALSNTQNPPSASMCSSDEVVKKTISP